MADTSRIELPWQAVVRRADPEFDRDRRHVLEYEFDRLRNFYRDPATSGLYPPFLADETGVGIDDESGNRIILDR